MTYCLTDSAGKEYLVQAERREDAERFAYVRGLCFTGRTAPRRGKWNADIIRDETTGEYRAVVSFEDKPDCEIYGNNYRDLLDNVVFLTGIQFPRRKYLKFSRLSDFETIAGIDASHTRESCVVTKSDRRAGWRRELVY